MRTSISSELSRVQELKAQIEPDRFFSNAHKRDREWNVLGATKDVLHSRSREFAFYAEEQERPDFATFLSNGAPWFPIEITEAFRPHERRHKKYRDIKVSGPLHRYLPPPLKDPWAPLQTAIQKKATAGYSPETALIVYYGLWLFDFQDWNLPVEQQIVKRHREEPFQYVEAFSRVFVLTSGMDAVVEFTRE